MLSAPSPLLGYRGPGRLCPGAAELAPHSGFYPQLLPIFQAHPGETGPLSASPLSPAVGPPLLIPLYFQYQIITSMIVHRDWVVSPGGPGVWGGGRLRRVDPGGLQGPWHLLLGWLPCHPQEGTSSEAARSQGGHSTPTLKIPPPRAPTGRATVLAELFRKFLKATYEPTHPRLCSSHRPPVSPCGP